MRWFGTTTVSVEDPVWKTIWLDAWAVYGWWSYNGSRTDSSDKPAANIGLIPINCTGTVAGPGDYSLSVSQQIEDDDHHCSQWINGDYNATNGDYIQVKGYIVTYTPVDTNAEPIMNNLATKLRNPLHVELGTGTRNIAVTSITPSKTVVGVGYPVKINVTLSNLGDFPECFNIVVYANTTVIQTILVNNILSTEVVMVEWNTDGWSKGNYTISAYALPVPGEANIADNEFRNGWVYVGLVGDVNLDGYVGIDDIVAVAEHFGTMPGDPNWNSIYDINCDNYVGIDDIVETAEHFGEMDP